MNKDNSPTRKCIVTKEILDKSNLLRFVTHDGVLYFDIKHSLPGRGIWVKSSLTVLQQAIEKNLFSRAAKEKVELPEDLIDVVEKQLKEDCSNNICLIARSGKFSARIDDILNHIKFDNIIMVFSFVKDESNSYKNLKDRCNYKSIDFIEDFDINIENLIGKSSVGYFAIINCKVAKIFKESYYKYREFKEINSEYRR